MVSISKAEQRRPKHPTQHITKQMSGSKTSDSIYNPIPTHIVRENMSLSEDEKIPRAVCDYYDVDYDCLLGDG